MPKKRIEFKKIALAAIAAWCMIYVTLSGIFDVNESVAQSMIYAVMGAYLSYCAASASDKASVNRYGMHRWEEYEMSEEKENEADGGEENEF